MILILKDFIFYKQTLYNLPCKYVNNVTNLYIINDIICKLSNMYIDEINKRDHLNKKV